MKLTNIPEYLSQLIYNQIKLPIFIGEMPSLSEEGVAIKMIDGNTNSRYFGDSTPLYEPLYQMFIRTKSYPAGKEAVQNIKDTLDGYKDNNIISLILVGSPLYLGRSTQKFHEFQVTFTAIIKEE